MTFFFPFWLPLLCMTVSRSIYISANNPICSFLWLSNILLYHIFFVHLVKAMVFPVVMYGCESWAIKKAEPQRIDTFELWWWRRLFESLLDSKGIQPVNPKGDQFWIFIGRTDAEAETPIVCPLDAKNWLIGKDPDAGKDWRQKKGMRWLDGILD